MVRMQHNKTVKKTADFPRRLLLLGAISYCLTFQLLFQAFLVHREDLDFLDLVVLRVKGVILDCRETLVSEDGGGPR
jgi:hypothetical protein